MKLTSFHTLNVVFLLFSFCLSANFKVAKDSLNRKKRSVTCATRFVSRMKTLLLTRLLRKIVPEVSVFLYFFFSFRSLREKSICRSKCLNSRNFRYFSFGAVLRTPHVPYVETYPLVALFSHNIHTLLNTLNLSPVLLNHS